MGDVDDRFSDTESETSSNMTVKTDLELSGGGEHINYLLIVHGCVRFH